MFVVDGDGRKIDFLARFESQRFWIQQEHFGDLTGVPFLRLKTNMSEPLGLFRFIDTLRLGS